MSRAIFMISNDQSEFLNVTFIPIIVCCCGRGGRVPGESFCRIRVNAFRIEMVGPHNPCGSAKEEAKCRRMTKDCEGCQSFDQSDNHGTFLILDWRLHMLSDTIPSSNQSPPLLVALGSPCRSDGTGVEGEDNDGEETFFGATGNCRLISNGGIADWLVYLINDCR